MATIQNPTRAQTLLTRVQGGATVDKALAESAIEAAAELPPGAARALIKDILTTSTSLTPQAKEALDAFVAAATPKTEPAAPLFGGVLSRWLGRSPPQREGAGDSAGDSADAAAAAGRILHQSPKDVLVSALEKIDPVLAQTVRVDSKYTVGLAGLAKLFPALDEALSAFTAATEPATALMTALLSTLPPPPPLSQLLSALSGGALLDRATAFDLMRAAQHEGASAATLSSALSPSKSTEAGAAFLQGFVDSPSRSVEGRYYDAHVAELRARDGLRAFDDAVKALDPQLAKLGHSELLLSGKYPHLSEAASAVSDLVKNPGVESWTAPAHDIVAKALRQVG